MPGEATRLDEVLSVWHRDRQEQARLQEGRLKGGVIAVCVIGRHGKGEARFFLE